LIFILDVVGRQAGTQNAHRVVFTYEGLELQADKRVEQKKKTNASAVCRGIPAKNRDSGE
jgi:hypothetical protein